MILLLVVGALAVGGALGLATGRRHVPRAPQRRSIDSDRADVQRGWSNMHGG